MTTTSYTFFRDGLKGKAKIYKGAWEEEDKNQPIMYQTTMKIMSSELFFYEELSKDEDDSDEDDNKNKKSIYKRYKEPVLTANYTNLLKTKGVMEGYQTKFPFKRMSSTLNDKWEFIDTLDNNKIYIWDAKFLFTAITTTNDDDQHEDQKIKEDNNQVLVAEFVRSTFDFKKQGTLIIHHDQIPSYLLSCIILSHKIIHQLID